MSDEIKVRKVRKTKLTDEEQKAAEKAEKKEQKFEDIEKMLAAFAGLSASISYARRLTHRCDNRRSVVSSQEFAVDIVNVQSALKKAYDDLRKLDEQVKSMRMNPWKKVIVNMRMDMFDLIRQSAIKIEEFISDEPAVV